MASVTAVTAFTRPSIIHQTFPGKPKFTEKDVKDLGGKVYIVTGSNTGVGRELARILYGANATVYMACRTESKVQDAIKDIQSAAQDSNGKLEFLQLDLSDLKTIQPAAEAFKAKESKLHVLFNNAGVMVPPPDKKTAQGYDMQLGTNCLGPVLFTNLLTESLKATAQQEPKGTVRVVWVSSSAAEIYSTKNGLNMDEVRNKETYGKGGAPLDLYGNSKAGNYLHSVEYARRHKDDGIVSVALNPGNLDSDLYRSVKDQTGLTKMALSILKGYMLHPQVYGAYTELWAGLSEEVKLEESGSWIGPWGKFYDIRKDLVEAGKPIDQGGKGVATAFFDWSIEQIKDFQGQSANL